MQTDYPRELSNVGPDWFTTIAYPEQPGTWQQVGMLPDGTLVESGSSASGRVRGIRLSILRTGHGGIEAYEGQARHWLPAFPIVFRDLTHLRARLTFRVEEPPPP